MSLAQTGRHQAKTKRLKCKHTSTDGINGGLASGLIEAMLQGVNSVSIAAIENATINYLSLLALLATYIEEIDDDGYYLIEDGHKIIL